MCIILGETKISKHCSCSWYSLCFRVRVYDTRLVDPVIVLRGHAGVVKCVQMDDWKVVSGGKDGMIIVWDQRMANKLWEQHHR